MPIFTAPQDSELLWHQRAIRARAMPAARPPTPRSQDVRYEAGSPRKVTQIVLSQHLERSGGQQEGPHRGRGPISARRWTRAVLAIASDLKLVLNSRRQVRTSGGPLTATLCLTRPQDHCRHLFGAAKPPMAAAAFSEDRSQGRPFGCYMPARYLATERGRVRPVSLKNCTIQLLLPRSAARRPPVGLCRPARDRPT